MATKKRINLISGPRNISTALMYSFAQRGDTCVIDEPLYGYYLLQNPSINHPGREEVIKYMNCDQESVLTKLTSKDFKKEILFIKNMAHHWTHLNFEWLQKFENVILIRHPQEVIISFTKKIPNPAIEDLGFATQYQIFKYLQQRPIVVNAKQILKDPKKALGVLCNKLGIKFDPVMLHWRKGGIKEDGIWAEYWYKNVHASTGFIPYKEKELELSEQYYPLLQQCMEYYHYLNNFSLDYEQ